MVKILFYTNQPPIISADKIHFISNRFKINDIVCHLWWHIFEFKGFTSIHQKKFGTKVAILNQFYRLRFRIKMSALQVWPAVPKKCSKRGTKGATNLQQISGPHPSALATSVLLWRRHPSLLRSGVWSPTLWSNNLFKHVCMNISTFPKPLLSWLLRNSWKQKTAGTPSRTSPDEPPLVHFYRNI